MGGRGSSSGGGGGSPTSDSAGGGGGKGSSSSKSTEKLTAGTTKLTMKTEMTATHVTVTVVRRLSDGERVESASASFSRRANGSLYPNHVNVEPAIQRQGVATRMYNAAQKISGGKIIASATQTPQGAALSKSFRGAK